VGPLDFAYPVHPTATPPVSGGRCYAATYESVDAQQDEVDGHGDCPVAVHHGAGDRLIVLEQIGQQALLVRRVAERVPSCNGPPTTSAK